MSSEGLSAVVARKLTPEELESYTAQFKACDADGSGRIDVAEVNASARALGHEVTEEDAKEMLADVDVDHDGTIDFEEFCKMMIHFRDSKDSHLRFVKSKGVGKHSWSREEKEAFARHINYHLEGDEALADRLPLDPESMDLFTSLSDGLLICKLVNSVVPDTVDERALTFPKGGKPLNVWERTANVNLAIGAAKSIGCKIVNFHAADMLDTLEQQSEILALGMLWQIVKQQVTQNISLKTNPQIAKLREGDEELADLIKMKPEALLLRWINYHVAKGGSGGKVIKNFGSDLKDGSVFVTLFHSIDPSCIPEHMSAASPTERATAALGAARTLGVPVIITAKDITEGRKNLILAFIAEVFNSSPGLDDIVVEAAELESLDKLLDDEEGDSREERVFRQWMNSLHLDAYIHNVFDDLSDGINLLQAIDKVEPGTVDWKHKVNTKQPMNRYKKGENCSYALKLGNEMRFSLVGIGSSDIMDGNKKLILALLWQLMRHHLLKMLRTLGGGKRVEEKQILKWANKTAEAAGCPFTISSFKDSKLKDSRFILFLISAIEARAVQWAVVPEECKDDNERALNAKYAISVARKIGASIFLTWEDIVEATPKMILTLMASLMMKHHEAKGEGAEGEAKDEKK